MACSAHDAGRGVPVALFLRPVRALHHSAGPTWCAAGRRGRAGGGAQLPDPERPLHRARRSSGVSAPHLFHHCAAWTESTCSQGWTNYRCRVLVSMCLYLSLDETFAPVCQNWSAPTTSTLQPAQAVATQHRMCGHAGASPASSRCRTRWHRRYASLRRLGRARWRLRDQLMRSWGSGGPMGRLVLLSLTALYA